MDLSPTFTPIALLPPLPKFLADLLYPPAQVEADKTQRKIEELETKLAAISQETAEPGNQPITIRSPLWMEGALYHKPLLYQKSGSCIKSLKA